MTRSEGRRAEAEGLTLTAESRNPGAGAGIRESKTCAIQDGCDHSLINTSIHRCTSRQSRHAALLRASPHPLLIMPAEHMVSWRTNKS